MRAVAKKLTWFAVLGAACATTAATAADCPDGFPSKPIDFRVGFGAGGGTDAIARSIAAAMEEMQDWTIVVDNQPGAGGGVMAASLKVSEPDGYTVGVAGTDTVAIVPYTSPDAQFTFADFDYLASAMQINYGLVARADRPYSTLEEFIEYAREKGRATISVGGTNQEIVVKQLGEHFGVTLVPVPGKGAASALQEALGGHVDATTQGSQHVQQIQSGDMVQLASLIDKRVDYAPDSKTLAESGVDPSVAMQAFTILMVPKGVDPAVKACLEGAIDEAVNSDRYGELMKNFDNKAINLGAEGITEVVEASAANYRKALGVD